MWLERYLTVYTIVVSVKVLLLQDPEKTPEAKLRTKRLLNAYQLMCPSGCLTCSPVSGCVTCNSGFYLLLQRDHIRQTGICVQDCPHGYFGLRHKNTNYNRCIKCHIDHCLYCASSSYCAVCNQPYVNHKGQCLPRCPEGLFYESYTKSCLPKVDCAVAEWNEWGVCTKNGQHCGYKYGLQSRRRETIQSPSPDGLACPALTEYRACRLEYRYCSDLATNNSELSHVNPQVTKRNHKSAAKRKKRLRRKRKRCKSKGRIWRRGSCLRSKKRGFNRNKLDTLLPTIVHNSLPDAEPKAHRLSNYKDWLQQMQRNSIAQ